jgi:hypothetical protein
MVMALAVAAAVGLVAPAGAAARTCHPTGHVLARRGGAVLWSIERRRRTRVYLCVPSAGGAELVTSGGRSLDPIASKPRVAGHFAAFVLTTGLEEDANLVVFNTARAHRELTVSLGCSTHACVLGSTRDLARWAFAPNVWIAELWGLNAPFESTSFVDGDQSLVATNDGTHSYSIDFGKPISALALSGHTLSWTADLSGEASVVLGPGVVPAAAPQPLTPCQLLTQADVTQVLGPHTSAESSGQCVYTSSASPATTLTLHIATGLSPAQISADESAVQSAGWDDVMSSGGGFPGFQNEMTSGGVSHQQLKAFENGAELSLDVTMPGASAGEQLAWLAYVSLERLFGVPVTRLF